MHLFRVSLLGPGALLAAALAASSLVAVAQTPAGPPLAPAAFGPALVATASQISAIDAGLAAQAPASPVVYYAQSSWLGVAIADISAAQARSLRLASPNGALVKSVVPDSPAAKAGIQPGDVIVAFRGRQVIGVRQLQRLVEDTPAHRTITVKIMRQGQPESLQVTLAAAHAGWPVRGPDEDVFTVPPMPPIHVQMPPMPKIPPMPRMPRWNLEFNFVPEPVARLGLSVATIPAQLAHYFGATTARAVLVRQVTPHSLAAKAGLRAGDVIVSVAGSPVTTTEELTGALQGQSGQTIAVTVLRSGRKLTLHLPPPAARVEPTNYSAAWAAWAAAERQWGQALAQYFRTHQGELRQYQREAQREAAAGQRLAQQIRRQLQPQLQQLRKQLEQMQKQHWNWQTTSGSAAS